MIVSHPRPSDISIVQSASSSTSDPSLEPKIKKAIEGISGDLDFNTIALEVFEFQYRNNPAYRNYSDAKDRTPDHIDHWSLIPAVPTDAFKLHEHPLTCRSSEELRRVFHTSGTTTEIKGHHHFPDLALYEKSIIEGWNQLELPVLGINHEAVFLTPHPDDTPHSSLSHMMGVLADQFPKGQVCWGIRPDGSFDLDNIRLVLSGSHPVAIFGTALSFLHFFEQSPAPAMLPANSWAMETGGYKGTDRSLSKEQLYQLFDQHLNLNPDAVINEYSMTELSSQFYTSGLNQKHQGPDWIRIRVIDPVTEQDAAPGTPGYLVIYDLANLHSVMAIQTQDIAIAHDNRSFTLIGRDPSALPRGCSRSSNSTLQSS